MTVSFPQTANRPRNHRVFHLLATRHRAAIIALWIFAIGYGCLVEIRGALIHTRHTDVGVYFSTAWAIRIGSNPYFAVDQNGWHYIIPPLFAILISPLADAPPTMHRYLLLPYAVSVGIWYVLSIFFFTVGVNRLAWALVNSLREKTLQMATLDDSTLCDPECPALPAKNTSRRWAWRWWVLCIVPVFLCLPAICRSVIRGQVGPLWLMLLCMMIADVMERRNMRAGFWLAGAICLKLIPAFLLIYPLWRRNPRMLLGCALGLLIGLGVIPWLAMGSHLFVQAYSQYIMSLIMPALTGGNIDPAIAHELVSPITSDTQSFVTVLMRMGNTFFDTSLSYSPPFFAKLGHVGLGVLLTIITLFSAGRLSRNREPLNEAMFLGLLITISLPVAPVCHPHYFMVMLPLVAAVLANFLGPKGQKKVTPGWIVLLAMLPLSHIITAMPGGQVFRDIGVVTWTAIVFWAAAARMLWKKTHATTEPGTDRPDPALFIQPAF